MAIELTVSAGLAGVPVIWHDEAHATQQLTVVAQATYQLAPNALAMLTTPRPIDVVVP